MDGRLVAHRKFKWEPKEAGKFFVGLNWAKEAPAEAAIRDLRIYAVPLTEGQVRAAMEGRRLERVEYLGLRTPRSVKVGERFKVSLVLRAPEGLSYQRYTVKGGIDGIPIRSFRFVPSEPIPPGARVEAGPIEALVLWWFYLDPGKHTLSVVLDDTLGSGIERARRILRLLPAPLGKERLQVEVRDGEVLVNGEPFLVGKPGYGFFFEGKFYPSESGEARKLALRLARSGRIVNAFRCRLVDFVDCSKEDHGYKETAPAKVVELALEGGERRKFRITGEPEEVTVKRRV